MLLVNGAVVVHSVLLLHRQSSWRHTDDIVAHLSDEDPSNRRRAVGELRHRRDDPEALRGLVKALEDELPEIRESAVWSLRDRRDDPQAVRGLVKALENELPKIRGIAAYVLGGATSQAGPAADGLVVATRDADPDVRATAILALEKLAVRSEAVTRAMLARIDDPDGRVRLFAQGAVTDTIADLRPEGGDARAAPIAQTLAAAWRDGRQDVRRFVARVLPKTGIATEATAGTLLALLDDPDETVRMFAELGLMDMVSASPALAPMVERGAADMPEEQTRRLLRFLRERRAGEAIERPNPGGG